MARVKFTSALKQFFPDLGETHVQSRTVKALIDDLDRQFPGIAGYLVEESGSLRKHVNIYIDDRLLQDRVQLSDVLRSENEILIYQALSGG